MKYPIRTIFFGTAEFAVPALDALVNNANFEVVGIVTQPDRPTGRKKIITPSPVKVAAEKLKISVLQPEKLKDEATSQIIALKPELAVVVAYGNLIPERLLEAVSSGFVNIHPSLLPKHRGASPITATILDGDKEAGVCLMVLDEGMDHGPIIACRRIALKGDETTVSLRALLTPIGADMIGKELVEYINGKIEPKTQDHDQATFCQQIESADAKIDWHKPISEIERLVRAMNGVTPAWTMLGERTFLIHRARPFKDKTADPVGMLAKKDNQLAVVCSDGHLFLDEIQLAGKKSMSGQAFLNGHKDLIGKILK
jgi:methionyl-tRNA formyltransferase